MSNTLRYICSTKDNAVLAAAVQDLKDFFEKADQEKEFLKARLEKIDKEREEKWDVIRKALETEKLVTDVYLDKYSIMLGHNMTQVLIDEKAESGIGDILSEILR